MFKTFSFIFNFLQIQQNKKNFSQFFTYYKFSEILKILRIFVNFKKNYKKKRFSGLFLFF